MKVKPIPASIILHVVVCLLIASSASAVEVITQEDIVQGTVKQETLIRVVDNAIFMLDASSSMNDKFQDTGKTCWQLIRQFVTDRNASFPSIGHKVGVYLYTPWKEIYPFGPYDRAKMTAALETLPEEGKGPTPLWAGMQELNKLLKQASGSTAVFLLTDGTHTGGSAQKPVDIAEQMVGRYNVCFYVISTAKNDVNEQLLYKVGNLNACSRVIPFSSFIQNPTYTTGALYDVRATTVPITVTKQKVVGLKVDDLTFRFNKADLREEDRKDMQEVIAFLKAHPEAWVRIAGYTDDVGSQEANLTLSKGRVEAVEQMLVSAGIDAGRIVTHWYGESNPVATNDTEEGQALNRRVEIAIGM